MKGENFLDLLTLLGTAIALAMDAFAVATVVSACLPAITSRHIFRLSWHFGFFQGVMPILGWLLGTVFSSLVASYTYWISTALLVFIGGRMIRESRQEKDESCSYDPTKGWSLVGLSVATSIDALAVGLSIGLLGISIWIPALVICIITIIITCIGMSIGRAAGRFLGPWAEVSGGIILIIIGLRIFLMQQGI